MKYKKKPVEIEAIQLTKENTCEVLTFCNHSGDIIASNDDDGTISIKTLEGTMVANIGDYVIKGVAGEFYPCKPDIFEATYDLVEEETWEQHLPDLTMKLEPAEIANIAEWLDNDPRMKKVKFNSDDCSLHFEVQYLDTDLTDGIKEASFTIYEGTTIVRENGIYRTEHRNG